MRTVLIPTDFSKNALHALQYAQELYKCERACFFVLHAYADEVYGEFKNVDQDKLDELKDKKGVTRYTNSWRRMDSLPNCCY